MYKCLLPEFTLTGASIEPQLQSPTAVPHCSPLLQSPIAVPYCSPPLQSPIAAPHCSPLLQSPIAVRYCSPLLQSPTAVPYCSPPLQSTPSTLIYCEGELFGPPNRAPILGKAEYNWEVAWYPRGCR